MLSFVIYVRASYRIISIVVAEITNSEVAVDNAWKVDLVLHPVASTGETREHLLTVRPIVDVEKVIHQKELTDGIEQVEDFDQKIEDRKSVV